MRIFLLSLSFSFSCFLQAQQVTIEEKPLVLPTYEIGDPDVNPIFFTGRVYQGAQGHIYPYALYDVLTDTKVDKTYNAVFLDNEYVNVCVLPEIGGRILSATDKTNEYEIFYRQTGIKPALIGMLGAWLSGGVEWNIPHHHRPSSYMPIDWKIEENEDGSKTVWVGEMELRHRMKWSIGITVYPGRSWVEARVKLMNHTPMIQSLLYWANVSVHCDENYEVIFPPRTQFGTDHSKVYFTQWPRGETVLGSKNIENLAWWKNYTGGARSVFAWNFDDDFLAGYDHQKNAGTVHVANHHIVNGKKFFLWGNNPSAEMWNKMLSDKDGHYLELMVGAYSDNQPDYSWIGPGETREFVQRWYGIRDIKSVKNATDDAAVNLDRESPDKMFLGFNVTTRYENARVVLARKDTIVWEKYIDIDPSTPFVSYVSVDKEAKDSEFTVSLEDAQGNLLVNYTPVDLAETSLPEVVEGTKAVQDYQTVEELYYAGLRIEQFHNARLDAMDFYCEALKRDSLDSRVNTVVGIRYIRMGEWALAEKHLKRALLRPSKDYTVVKDPEPHYYLGVVYQQQGRYKEAINQFWKATWYPTFQHAAYLALAQIMSCSGNWEQALELVDEALAVGFKDTKAQTLKAYLLRKQGKLEEASQVLDIIKKIDPLDYWSLAEESLLSMHSMGFLTKAERQRGQGIIRVQELLELSLNYAQIGAFPEAAELLDKGLDIGEPYQSSPLIYLYSGYFHYLLGQKEKALRLWKQATLLPTDGCFPFRTEEIGMLLEIEKNCPSEAKISYYLGNLYYYLGQKERGVICWELAVKKDSQFAQAYRNLGFGYQRAGRLDEAVAAYEKGVSLNKQDPRYFLELDILYARNKKPAKERLDLLERNMSTVLKHDESVIRLLALYNETGNYDKAISLLDKRHFHVWEGGGEIHDIYVDSHLLKGMEFLQHKRYREALTEFEAADLYPENLEVGRPTGGGHSAKGLYYMGKTYRLIGDEINSKKYFSQLIEMPEGRRNLLVSEKTLFKALAMRELGNVTEAEILLSKFQSELTKQLSGQIMVDSYSKFGEDGSREERVAYLYYLDGLVKMYTHQEEAGRISLKKAIDIAPNIIWAKQFMKYNL